MIKSQLRDFLLILLVLVPYSEGQKLQQQGEQRLKFSAEFQYAGITLSEGTMGRTPIFYEAISKGKVKQHIEHILGVYYKMGGMYLNFPIYQNDSPEVNKLWRFKNGTWVISKDTVGNLQVRAVQLKDSVRSPDKPGEWKYFHNGSYHYDDTTFQVKFHSGENLIQGAQSHKCNWYRYDHTECHGSELGNDVYPMIEEMSLAQCMRECQARIKCKAIGLELSGTKRQCYLESIDMDIRLCVHSTVNKTLYMKRMDCEWTAHMNTDCPEISADGTAIAIYPFPLADPETLWGCETACLSDGNCVALVRERFDGERRCFLYSKAMKRDHCQRYDGFDLYMRKVESDGERPPDDQGVATIPAGATTPTTGTTLPPVHWADDGEGKGGASGKKGGLSSTGYAFLKIYLLIYILYNLFLVNFVQF